MLWWYSQQVHAECIQRHVSLLGLTIGVWSLQEFNCHTFRPPAWPSWERVDKASNAATSQGTAKQCRRLTAFGDQGLKVNSGTFRIVTRVSRMPVSAEPCISKASSQPQDSCRHLSGQTMRSVVCLTTCLELHDELARGIPCSRRVSTMASEDSTSTAFRVAVSTRIAGPLFSIILTAPAPTRAVRLSHHCCHFPASSTVMAETKRGASHQAERQRETPSAMLSRTQKAATAARCFVVA